MKSTGELFYHFHKRKMRYTNKKVFNVFSQTVDEKRPFFKPSPSLGATIPKGRIGHKYGTTSLYFRIQYAKA